MANCYVFNISKYKTDDIKGIAKHNLRDLNDLSRTTNIDPSRTKNNLYFDFNDLSKPINSLNYETFKSKLNSIIKRDNEKQVIKKSTNVLLNFTISASPEYFFKDLDTPEKLQRWSNLRIEDPKEKLEIQKIWESLDKEKFEKWKDTVIDYIKSKDEFKDLGISLNLHMDEKTPHFDLALCPKVGNKVDCKHFFTPIALEKWRKELDKIFTPLGLDRVKDEAPGVRDNYKEISQLERERNEYLELGKVKAPSIIMKDEIFKDGFLGKKQVISTEQIIENRDKREKAHKEKLDYYRGFYEKNFEKVKAVKRLEVENRDLRLTNKKLQQKNKSLSKEQINDLRGIDCLEVVKSMGFNPKEEQDYYRIRTDKLNLVITKENKFTENKNKIQGGGAFDLLMKVFNFSFPQSIAFLTSRMKKDKNTVIQLAAKTQKEELNKLVQNSIIQDSIKQPDLSPFFDTSKSIEDEKKKLQEDERRREQERIERLNKSKNTTSFSPTP